MNNQSKQPWLRGWRYIILQNAILIGMPLIPFLYLTRDFSSVASTAHVAKFSAFSNGFMVYKRSMKIFEETDSSEAVAQFRLRCFIAKVIIYNLLFLLVIWKKQFIYSSVFLNVALGFWGWVTGFIIYVVPG
ncbi:MAG: hypothetical protein ACYTET_07850 [Planctomycetota bacterium]|jgi:hypothetical protein